MANFFEPGDAQTNQTNQTTPSAAQQAMMKFRAQLLGRLLDAKAGNKPTFKSFVGGGPVTTPFPAGMGGGMADVLAAMGQPGAFTSNSAISQTGHGPTPSMMNDVSQMLGLGVLGLNLIKSSGLWDLLKGKFGDTGAVQGATQPGGFGNEPATSGNPNQDLMALLQYGQNPQMIPGGGIGDVPADYPGLLDGFSSGGGGGYDQNQALLDLISSGIFG